MPVQRYRLTIAYRGTHYHGWQRQLPAATWKGPVPEPGCGIDTIQEILSRAIGAIVGHPIQLVGSSRTDAGVHALGQIAHFDTEKSQIPPDGLRRAVNHRLPDDIIIHAIEPVPSTFHAIRSTRAKRYEYVIHNAPDRDPLGADLAWHRWQPLDVPAMAEAAAHFVGEHDFASFAKPRHGRQNTIRAIHACAVTQAGPNIIIGIEGAGFLWNMVRIIAGTLVEIGLGQFMPDDIPRMLEARDRQSAGGTAPPHGLYLQWITTAEAPHGEPGQEGPVEP